MRSNAGMANRQGDVDLRFAHVSAPSFGLNECKTVRSLSMFRTVYMAYVKYNYIFTFT